MKRTLFLGVIAMLALASVAQAQPGPHDIVLHTRNGTRVGAWAVLPDGSAAGGSCMKDNSTAGTVNLNPIASPANYFEMTFNAHANVPYRVWLRMKADTAGMGSDQVFVQFNDAKNYAGADASDIGTINAISVALADSNNTAHTWRNPSGWGWNDANGVQRTGPGVIFRTTGPQTIRIQRGEDGVSIDQI